MNALLAALVLGTGLRLDLPEEAPTLGGVEVDLRWHLLPDAFVGGALAWEGGVNDTNPNHLLISQRIEAVALLGALLPVAHGYAVGATARAGVARLEGWPRGALTATRQFSPSLGGGLNAWLGLGEGLALEPRLETSFVRVGSDWRVVPGVAIALLIALDDP